MMHGHAGVPGNENSDELAQVGLASPPFGVELCLLVSGWIVKSAIKTGLVSDLKTKWCLHQVSPTTQEG